MSGNSAVEIINENGGFELSQIETQVLELTNTENRMYGRTRKSSDHILNFLSAGNVSEAEIEVSPGVVEKLDKRPEKPSFKECEIAEAAEAVRSLLVKAGSVEQKGEIEAVKEATHVISEAGDVIYNILQLYALSRLPEEDARRIELSSIAVSGIEALFSNNGNNLLVQFMTIVGLRKFDVRYNENGKKNVELEEALLVSEFGTSTLKMINAYGGLKNFVQAVKVCIFNYYAICINAADGRNHLLVQMLNTNDILRSMNIDSEG